MYLDVTVRAMTVCIMSVSEKDCFAYLFLFICSDFVDAVIYSFIFVLLSWVRSI